MTRENAGPAGRVRALLAARMIVPGGTALAQDASSAIELQPSEYENCITANTMWPGVARFASGFTRRCPNTAAPGRRQGIAPEPKESPPKPAPQSSAQRATIRR